MKQSTRYTALAVLSLTSALFLAACGGNKSETREASSSSQTTQMAKSTKPKRSTSASSSSVAKSDSPASSSSLADNQSSQVASSEAVTPTPQAPQANQATDKLANPATAKQDVPQMKKASNDREKGVLAMTKGDLSKAAGVWTDTKGNTVTVDPSGAITVQKAGGEEQSYTLYGYNYTLDDGKFNAQLTGEDGSKTSVQITTGDDGMVTGVQVMP